MRLPHDFRCHTCEQQPSLPEPFQNQIKHRPAAVDPHRFSPPLFLAAGPSPPDTPVPPRLPTVDEVSELRATKPFASTDQAPTNASKWEPTKLLRKRRWACGYMGPWKVSRTLTTAYHEVIAPYMTRGCNATRNVNATSQALTLPCGTTESQSNGVYAGLEGSTCSNNPIGSKIRSCSVAIP